jgi:ABC-type Fe3+ transport system permease subunit
MQRFWSVFADALVYAVFQVPSVLLALGYGISYKKFGLNSLSVFLGSAVGRVFVVLVLVGVGIFFARLVQIGFRDLGWPGPQPPKKRK